MTHSRLQAATLLALVAWCLAVVVIGSTALAASTPCTFCAPQRRKDTRVQLLRAALLDKRYHLEALPDPPPHLGVHTACKKFGRGCPDSYIQFLEEFLASLRCIDAGGDVDARNAATQNTVKCGMMNATPPDHVVEDKAVATQVEPVGKFPNENVKDVDGDRGDAAVPLVSHTLRDLRLPVQLSWSYEDRRRLENILHLVSTREAGLRRDGVVPKSLQRRYHVPSAEQIHLVEDLDGSMAMWLHAACAMGSSPLPAGWTKQLWEDVYGLWCRHAERQFGHPQMGSKNTTDATSVIPSEILALPHRAWYCTALRHAAVYMRLLVQADEFVTVALSWTFFIAVPSAFIACLLVWLCVGDPWTEAAETFMTGILSIASNPAQRNNREVKVSGGRRDSAFGSRVSKWRFLSRMVVSSSPAVAHPTRRDEVASLTLPIASAALSEGRHDPTPGLFDATDSLEHYRHKCIHQRQQQQERRILLLRCRFAESTLHRSSALFFLKLRLLLCVLVAGQLLWTLWRVLAASYSVTASAAPLLQFFIPSWLLASLSAYIVVPVATMALGTALKGALDAHEELLSFQVKCAAEHRALLNAAGVGVTVCPPSTPRPH